MTLQELKSKSVLILGFGIEGQATYEFLRRHWPSKELSLADRRTLQDLPETIRLRIQTDPLLNLSFGERYLDSCSHGCEVIIKTPGIPASLEAIARARQSGSRLTSHSQIFLSNYPRERVIGVTGTKGKSTTTSLIHQMLKSGGLRSELVGNIGQPPLARIDSTSRDAFFVHEFSSHQLAEIETSPHIAVLLNIVPEHLDYYASFDEYASAKENITKFQGPDDFLVYAADYPVTSAIAGRTKAALRPFSSRDSLDEFIDVKEIPLPGAFNRQNVIAAATAASLCGVGSSAIGDAIRHFQPLPHRLERVGTFKEITFYDDSIATVPDATLAALAALGPDVQTLILGGHERHLDFTVLGQNLPPGVATVILFPPTGARIWKAIQTHSKNPALPEAFFVADMEQAVKAAFERTNPGKICLLSPASPSFGAFKDYAERGDLFKAFIKKFSSS